MIHLVHPIHGSKFALSDTEAEYDAANGWTRYTEATPVEVAAPRRRRRADPVEQPNSNALVSDESEGS